MDKKRIVNRYTLVGLEEEIEIYIKTSKDITDINMEILKNNSKSNSEYLYGDVIIDRYNKRVTYKKYKKLTIPCTLEELDKYILNFPDFESLLNNLGYTSNKIENISIAYKFNKRVKLLQVVYSTHKDYLNRVNAKRKIFKMGTNKEFITAILKSPTIRANIRLSAYEFDRLFELRNSLKYSIEYADTIILEDFFYKFISEGGKFNYFNFRLLMLTLIEFEASNRCMNSESENTQNEPLQIEKKVASIVEGSDQLMLTEFLRAQLRSEKEDGEIDMTYGKAQAKKLKF